MTMSKTIHRFVDIEYKIY